MMTEETSQIVRSVRSSNGRATNEFAEIRCLHAGNTLTQLMQNESLDFTVRMDVSQMQNNARGGLAMLQKNPNGLQVAQQAGTRRLQFFNNSESTEGPDVQADSVELRVHVDGDRVLYSYSLDEGHSFHQLGVEAQIAFSFWKGSRPALFAYTLRQEGGAPETGTDSNHSGWIDFDWAHYLPIH